MMNMASSPSAPSHVSAVSTKLVAIFQAINRPISLIACSRCWGLFASNRVRMRKVPSGVVMRQAGTNSSPSSSIRRATAS